MRLQNVVTALSKISAVKTLQVTGPAIVVPTCINFPLDKCQIHIKVDAPSIAVKTGLTETSDGDAGLPGIMRRDSH